MAYNEISAHVAESLAMVRALNYVNVLYGYRVINRIDDLDMGKHVRWIRRNASPYLTAGGIAVDISGNNIRILCITRQIINVDFNSCLVFQKLSPEELLIAMAYNQHS